MNCPDAEGDWLGLALGLARFGVWHLARGAQIQRAIRFGLMLGLVRFGSVWLGLGRSVGTAETSDWLGLALGLAISMIWFGQSIPNIREPDYLYHCKTFIFAANKSELDPAPV